MHISLFLLLFLNIFTISPLCQAQPSKIVIESSDLYTRIRDFINTISSPIFQGRLTGTSGEQKAKQFLLNTLEDIEGISSYTPMLNSFEHHFSFYNPSLNDSGTSFTLNRTPLNLGEDFLPFVTSSSIQNFSRENLIILSCDNPINLNISGHIAVVLESDCNEQIFVHKKSLLGILKHIASQDPSMIIVISKNQNIYKNETIWFNHIDPSIKEDWLRRGRNLDMAITQRRAMMFDDMDPLSIPALYVLESSFLRHLGPVMLKPGIVFSAKSDVQLDLSKHYLSGTNIIAHIQGKTSMNVVLSAHYDSHGLDEQGHHFPGADDNASGVAAALEIFCQSELASRFEQPENGLILALFSGEEWGLVGSRSFTRELRINNLSPMILADINLDSISRGDKNTLFTLGSLTNPDLVDFIDGTSDQNHRPDDFDLVFKRNLEFAFREGSDHYAFHEIGVPSIDITSGKSSEMDSVNDLPETIDIDKILHLIRYLKDPILDLLYSDRLKFETPQRIYAPFPDSPRAQAPLQHNLDIWVEPNRTTENLVVKDSFGFNQKPESLRLSSLAQQLQLSFNDIPISFDIKKSDQQKYMVIVPRYPNDLLDTSGTLSFSFSFSIDPQEDNSSQDNTSSRLESGNEHPILVNLKGLYLSPEGYWYPRKDLLTDTNLEQFVVHTHLPDGWSAVTNGFSQNATTWLIEKPSQPIYLVGGPYIKSEKLYRGIRLQTYFYDDIQNQSSSYLAKLESYIDRYMNMFGSFPYSKFSVVSNFFSTGYGMPSFTLLDRNIIPFPFIKDISLGHELLHNYWGNSVLVKPGSGNWCEGLTTFLADYLYEKEKGPDFAREYRANILRDYQNYVTRENVFALRDFTERNSAASRLIGYGKGMMFWSMLEEKIGSERFLYGLQKIINTKSFQFISYDDFRQVFESDSQTSLATFFDQWLNRTDIPDLTLTMRSDSSSEETIVTINQFTDTPYSLDVPIHIDFADNTFKDMYVFINSSSNETILHEVKPIKSITLDPNFQLMRTLSSSENPPTLSRFFGVNHSSFYSSIPVDSQVTSFFNALSQTTDPVNVTFLNFLTQDDLTNLDTQSAHAILIEPSHLNTPWVKKIMSGLPFRVDGNLASLEGSTPINIQDHFIVLSTNINARPTLIIIVSTSPKTGSMEKLAMLGQRLLHYGKYSYLVFDQDGVKTLSGVWKNYNLYP